MKLLSELDDIPLGKKGAALIFLPTFVLVLFGFAVWRFYHLLVIDQGKVLHSRKVLMICEELLAEVNRAQNDSWAYALSGLPQMDLSSRGHVARLKELFQELKSLTGENKHQLAALESLPGNIQLLEVQVEKISAAVKQGKREMVVDVLGELPVYQRAAAIRQGFEKFIQEEHRLMEERSTKLISSTRRLAVGFFAGICVSSLAALILGRMFAQRLTRRIGAVISNIDSFSGNRSLTEVDQGKDEIGKIDRAFHQMAEAITERSHETELFLYSVSHDLRSPLLNLQGFSQELKFNADDLKADLSSLDTDSAGRIRKIIDEDFDQSIRYIHSSVQRLSVIIDALLQLSRVGRLELHFEQLDLSSIVERVVDSLRVSLAEKNASITLLPLPLVFGDASNMERALANLIGNAVQYLDPSRPGKITIGTAESSAPNSATIFVTDNGLGFPEGSVEKVFLPFQRFHRGNSKGEGIGLALVRKIVAKSHGRIWLTTESGVGTTFYVALPTVKPEKELEFGPDSANRIFAS